MTVPYPQNHDDFIQWAENIATEMANTSNNQLRIGKNKLAAIMAAQLPNVPDDFNINTLKPCFSQQIRNIQSRKVHNLQPLLNKLKIDMRDVLNETMRQTVDALINDTNPYDTLKETFEDAFANTHKLHVHDFHNLMAQLTAFDPDRFEAACGNTDKELIKKGDLLNMLQLGTGIAYQDVLLDTLYCFLSECLLAHRDQQHVICTPIELPQWIALSFSLWQGDESFTGESRLYSLSFDRASGYIHNKRARAHEQDQ
jgi:hypothetical protein